LQQNIASSCAYRHADADFAGSFGDRNQHDIHDADTAYQQRHRCDRAEHRRHGLGGAGSGLRYCGEVADRKIIFLPGMNPVPNLEQFVHAAFGFVHDFGRFGFDHDEANHTGELIAEQLALSGGNRDKHGIVLISSIQALAFRRQDAQHQERAVFT
jgi:hypothetical protein